MKRFGPQKSRAGPPRREATNKSPPRRIPALGLQPLIGNRAVAAMLQSFGQPLGETTRAGMEARFGEDFSAVRLHSGGSAAAAADAVHADAFTVGEDVVFNAGRLAPDETAGKRLLAHELAHVVQQRRGGASVAGSPKLDRSAAKAAGAMADREVPVTVEGASAPGLAAQEKSQLPQGPTIAFDTADGIRTVSVAEVKVFAYRDSLDVKVVVQWSSQAPGVIFAGIVRKPNTPAHLDPNAEALLQAQGYRLVVAERLLPIEYGELSERPLKIGRQPPPPPQPKPKPKAKPTGSKKEQKQEPKPPELPRLPAPEQLDLPPLPPPQSEQDVIPAAVPLKVEEPAPAPQPEITPPVRTPEQLIDDNTSLGNLHEEDLGADLLKRALRGDSDYVQRVLDTLGSTDRDDVAVAFAEAASDEDLRKLAGSPEGRRLLDRLFDELTAGEVFEDEQKQADRILAIKTRAIQTEEQFAKGLEYAKSHIVLPYRKPGLTVITPSPIYARRLPDGKVWIRLRTDIYGTDYYRDPDIHLPDRIWDEVVLNETDVVGVKFYDQGGVISYFPALYLLQLENESTRVALEKAGEAVGIGLTLGFGGAGVAGGEAAAGAAEVSTLARVGAGVRTGLVWADRIAFTLDIANSIIQEHRGWIIETWPDQGRGFVTSLDQITAYVRIYGLARGGMGLVQLGNALRKSYKNWRTAVNAAKLAESELQRVEQIGQKVEELLDSVEDAAKTKPPGGAPPPEQASGTRDSPIRDVVEGGGETSARRTGHLRVAGSEEVVQVPEVVITAEEALEEVESEVRAVSSSKERFAQPQAARRYITQKTPPTPAKTITAAVAETETAVPKRSGGGGSGGRGGSGGGKKAGTAAEEREIKAYVLEKAKEELRGIKPDPTEFLAVHEEVTIGKRQVGGNSSFNDIATELDNSSKLRAQSNKAPLPLNGDKIEKLLAEGEINFIKRNKDLDKLYTQLEDLTNGKPVPELENLQLSPKRIGEIREELDNLKVRRIGKLRTDITEVWFDQKRVEIADISLRENDPLHEFKTLLYKRVMEEMLPGYTVRAQDIKPRPGKYWSYLFKLIGE